MFNLRALLLKLLSRYFGISRVPASFTQLVGSCPRPIVVTQGSSLVMQAMLDSFARRTGIAHVRHCRSLVSHNGTAALMDSNALYWLDINDQQTLERIVQHYQDHPFSTLNIFRIRGPAKRRPKYKMSFWQQGALLIGSRFLLVIFGQPIRLGAGAAVHGQQYARQLKLDFYRNLKLVRGAPFQSISSQADAILGGAEYDREIRLIANRMHLAERQVRIMARREFFKMAANPRAPLYLLASPICSFILKRLFSDIHVEGLDTLTRAVRDSTVVIVPMHRSHFDYIVLGYKLYESDLNPPVVAAGINLNFWPFGWVIRSIGGYFVKRNARYDRIHALLLRRYVTYLIKRGHLQEFFIEGGRSRSGRMGQPKVGLLSTFVSAFLKGIKRDILFIPVSITYENVIEDEVYGDENTGRSKVKENLTSLFRARHIFRKRYGDVLIKFGNSLSLADLAGRISNGQPLKPSDERSLVSTLANQLTQTIRDQSDITLTGLAYTALLTSPAYGLTRRELTLSIANLSRLARLAGSALNVNPRFTQSLEHFLSGRENLVYDLARGGVIRISDCLKDTVFYIPGNKRFTADFYRNFSIHLFFLPSLFSILELTNGHIALQDALQYHDIFSPDFQLAGRGEFEKDFTSLLEEFRRVGVLTGDNGAVRFSSREAGLFVPALLLSSIQTILWIHANLHSLLDPLTEETGKGQGNAALGSCPYEKLMEKLQSDFRTAGYLGTVTRTEASSQSAVIPALEALRSRQIISYEEGARADRKIILLRDPLEDIALLERANEAVRSWQFQSMKQNISRTQ